MDLFIQISRPRNGEILILAVANMLPKMVKIITAEPQKIEQLQTKLPQCSNIIYRPPRNFYEHHFIKIISLWKSLEKSVPLPMLQEISVLNVPPPN